MKVGWLVLLEESMRGKIHEMTGFIVGSDAQTMPVLTSMLDQIAASVLDPKFPVNKTFALGSKTRLTGDILGYRYVV
jgi:hypothetical protein